VSRLNFCFAGLRVIADPAFTFLPGKMQAFPALPITMRILFIHQNFPGQFKHLAPALAANPDNEVVAMTINPSPAIEGVRIVRYPVTRGSTQAIHPWVGEIETKVIRGEAAYRAAIVMRAEGFTPDVIIAHPGWGESLFVKEVWPNAKLGIYSEFFYVAHDADVGFDPEFPVEDEANACRLRMKNVNNLLHFQIADAALSPTHWQRSVFPESFRSKISVIHDGIDTDVVKPDPLVSLSFNSGLKLSRDDEVITFVNRNLEPYRGYHIFMRALPAILRARPNAVVLIVGSDSVSYGAKAPDGKKWRDIFFDEVKADLDVSRVHFLGQIPYHLFIPLLQLSTVHIYLTYPFVLSWSMLEAMSAGCAIVASNTQPVSEAIVHDETGRLVDFFDAAALAKEVIDLLGQPATRERLGRAAREFARRNYDLQSICLPRQLAWVQALGSVSASDTKALHESAKVL
jgi:glycosyltransferase involved in cell wall biosynthesis